MNLLNDYHSLITRAIEQHYFSDQPRELYEPLNEMLSQGGKRLRPILALMASKLFGGDLNKTLKPALALELFHNFTLIHDDIMDAADTRRNFQTIFSKYGVNTGILSGDALMIKAYQFFEGLEPSLFKRCLTTFSKMAADLCEGQQMDVNFETQDHVSYKDYLTMITDKTGVLIAASLQIGALIGNAPEEDLQNLYKYGLNVGIAFQIMDDYLDVFGEPSKFGKKHGGDIFENKKTALYLIAQKFTTGRNRQELDYWYARKTDNLDKVFSVEKIFKETKVDKIALRLIHRYSEKALCYLNKIDRPAAEKEPFIELTDYLLNRQV